MMRKLIVPGTSGDATHTPQIVWGPYGEILSVVNTLITGTAPGGAAGGDLAGTYPNPTLAMQAWTTYTPVITQSGAPTFTNTYAKSMTLGKLRIVGVKLDLTGAGTANNKITVSLPAGGANGVANQALGTGQVKLAGSIYGVVNVRLDSTGATPPLVHFVRPDVIATNVMGIDPNAALANLDLISFVVCYELV